MALVMSPENLMPPSAITGTPVPCAARDASMNRGDLRNARAGYHARGADRARPDANLQPVDAQRDQIARAFGGGDVSGEQLHFRELALHFADRVHHAGGVAVRGVDRQHVHFFARHFLGALQKIARRADGRAHAQAALLVFRGVREFEFLLNVLYGDQALEIEILVHHQQLLDAMPLKNLLGFFERGAHRHGDQIVLGHHLADGLVEVALEAQVAVRQDSHQARPARHRKPGDLVLVHDFERLADGHFRARSSPDRRSCRFPSASPGPLPRPGVRWSCCGE